MMNSIRNLTREPPVAPVNPNTTVILGMKTPNTYAIPHKNVASPIHLNHENSHPEKKISSILSRQIQLNINK